MEIYEAHKNIYTFKNDKLTRHYDINTGIIYNDKGKPVKNLPVMTEYGYQYKSDSPEIKIGKMIRKCLYYGVNHEDICLWEKIAKIALSREPEKKIIGIYPNNISEIPKEITKKIIKQLSKTEISPCGYFINLYDFFTEGFCLIAPQEYNIRADFARCILSLYGLIKAITFLNECTPVERQRLQRCYDNDIIHWQQIDIIHCAHLMGEQVPKVREYKKWLEEMRNAWQIYQKTTQTERIIKNYQRTAPLWNFTYNGFTIVTPTCSQDLVTEGNKMHHCVGIYADKVANKETYICFVRKVDDIDTPYITCQVCLDGKINQYFLVHNQRITSETDKEFKQAFQNHITKTIQEYGLTL